MTDKEFIEKAREQYAKDGEIEIDDDALLTGQHEGGAYVQAWVWVDCDEGGEPQP